MTLHLLSEEDAELVDSLDSEIFPCLVSGTDKSSSGSGISYEQFYHFCLNKQGYILKDEDISIGYMIYLSDQAYIYSFGILPAFRGQGYGSKLMAMFLEKKKDKKKNWSLHVRKSNSIAQLLYVKNGFEALEIINNYYGSEDGIYMIRKIESS